MLLVCIVISIRGIAGAFTATIQCVLDLLAWLLILEGSLDFQTRYDNRRRLARIMDFRSGRSQKISTLQKEKQEWEE